MDKIDVSEIINIAEVISKLNTTAAAAKLSGQFRNVRLDDVHRPKDGAMAYALLVFDNFVHHTATVMCGRLRNKLLLNSGEHSTTSLRKLLRTDQSAYAMRVFNLAYKDASEMWTSRPWLLNGVNAEPAMQECGIYLMRNLPGLIYPDAGNPFGMMLNPILAFVIECMSRVFTFAQTTEAKDFLSALSYPLEWVEEVGTKNVRTDNSSLRRIPTSPFKASESVLRNLSVVAFPSVMTGHDALIYGYTEGLPGDAQPRQLYVHSGQLFIIDKPQAKGENFDPSLHIKI